MKQLSENDKAEIAVMLRKLHATQCTMNDLVDGKREARNKISLAEFNAMWSAIFRIRDELGAALDPVETWFTRHDSDDELLIQCDGRFYLRVDGELITVDPARAIDVSEAKTETVAEPAESRPSLREAAHSLYNLFRCDQGMHPYIASIGEAKTTGTIHVHLVREPRHHEQQIPSEWEGWPVKTRVTGRMVAG